MNIKSYTDIEQSRKLVEILPIESADMKWFFWKDEIVKLPTFGYSKESAEFYKETEAVYLPCWSLAALLSILPNNENISTNFSRGGYRISTLEYTSSWFVDYEDETNGLNNCVTSADNPVDACVEMVVKLHEQKLL